MNTISKFAAAAVAALSMAGTAHAAAFVQVATSGLTGTDQVQWDGTAPGQGTLTVNDIMTVLNFDDSVYDDGVLGGVAYLTLVGATDAGATLDTSLPNFTQTGINGFFEFRTAAGGGGSLLLRGDFSNYWLTGVTGANAGNLSPLGGSLNFTSDVVDLSFVKGDNASFTFSNVAPAYGITGGQLDDFDGSNLSGTFAGVVPEPSTWALMIGGFMGAGVALRRRRALVAAA